MPLAAGDDVTCPSCGGHQPLPEHYRVVRDARLLSAEADRELQRLSAEVNQPPPVWKRAMVIVGFVVGGITVIVLALGTLLGALFGLFAGSKTSGDNDGAMIFVYLCAAVAALVSVPYVGEFLALSQVHNSLDQVDAVMFGRSSSLLGLDLGIGAFLYAFGVVPIAVAYRSKVKLDGLDAIRAQLTAKPASTGGGWECRRCGAPLTVAEGAIAVPCLYCGTESLVKVDRNAALSQQQRAASAFESVQDAWASVNSARWEERQRMRTLLIYGPLLAPFVALGGVVMRALFA